MVGGNDLGAPDHVRLGYLTTLEHLNTAFDCLDRVLARVKK